MELYRRIRKRREQLNMTQDDLAIKLGYKSRSSINKIELGKADIPQSKIQAFADALYTTPAFLMGWTNDPHDWEQIGNDEGIYPPKDYKGSYEDYVKYKLIQESDDIIDNYYDTYDKAIKYLENLNCKAEEIQGTEEIIITTPHNETFTVNINDLIYNFMIFGNSLPGLKKLITPRKIDTISDKEQNLIKKYNVLDDKGKHTVNTVLEIEYTRCTEPNLLPDAAHEIEGATDEDKAHDDAIMDDDNF